MIRNYSDHAANERTFLSWLRTGIAVVAFGFVVEKFNLFMLTLARSLAPEEHGAQLQLQRLSGGVGRYEGLAFVACGVLLIVLATVRFARTTSLIDQQTTFSAGNVRLELIVSAILVLLVASYSIYIAIG
jgi:putative membrane protein